MQANPYFLPLLLAALASLAAARLAWQRRASRGGWALTTMLLGAAEWALASALQVSMPTLAGQLFWFRVRFFGTELIALSFFSFAVLYLGRAWLTRQRWAALLLVPVLSLALLWFEGGLGLFLREAALVPLDGFVMLRVAYGPLFWLHTAYDYALLTAGLYLFAQAFRSAPRLYRRQFVAILITILAPLAANALTLSGLSPFPNLDLTPFGFTLSGLVMVAGFVGFGILDIVPAARDAVIQNMDDAVLILDGMERLVDLNPAAERLLGQPAEQAVGRRLAELLTDWPAALAAAEAGRGPTQVALPFAQPGAEPTRHEYELRLTPIVERTGRTTGRAVLLRDLTERKTVEASLRESRLLFDEVIESIADGYYETNVLGTLTFVNSAFATAVNYSPTEIVGQSFRRFTDRGNARRMFQDFGRVFKTGQAMLGAYYEFRRRDGSPLFAEMSVALRFGPNGEPAGFRGLIRDITDRRLAEEALRQSEEKYRTLLDNIEDGYYELDLTGTFTYMTDVTAKIAGVAKDAAMGRNFADFTDRRSALALFQVFNRLFRTGEPVKSFDYTLTQPDGSPRYLEASASLIRDRLGQPMGFRGIIRDMTEGRQAQAEVQRAKEAAEAANQAKSTFLATVSHELRTPLTSVLGFAKLIKKRMQEAVVPAVDTSDRRVARALNQVTENLDIIVSEGERLTALINNLLDLAKIEAGKVEWEMRPTAVSEVIVRAVTATRTLAEQKQLDLVTDITPGLPLLVGDFDRLLQVLINLLSNAIKFTPAGSVTCRAWGEGSHVLVSVSDTGIGLAPQDLGRVFDQFVQIGNTLTDKPMGTGLGLPICKQIVEQHGGSIWVESELGRGSRFIVRLPIAGRGSADAAAAAVAEPVVQSIDFKTLVQDLRARVNSTAVTDGSAAKQVLIVDDDAHIRSLLRQELEADGYVVHAAENGREALAYVKQSRPDVIILDVMMPELSGYDVAAVLRNDPATREIPIIILSVIRDRERGYRLGVDRYLTKPVDAEALLAEVGQLVARGTSQKSVLIVDRDAAVVKTLSDALQTHGYSVVAAYDGPAGIEKALSTRPNLVIASSRLSDEFRLVHTLRLENGMDNVSFLIFNN
jgi:PAS domain S-box-containing protein